MGLDIESVGRIERNWDVECGMWNERNNGKIWANKSIKKSSTSWRHAKGAKGPKYYYYYYYYYHHHYHYHHHSCFFASNMGFMLF
jgi:hypothetical protein